ncbi:hypothetical protein HY642_06665 [Candidatus Woesearchaeota archaeon]|nr:hypothetical protein [Candidatus Woesearchaeota archaeon]
MHWRQAQLSVFIIVGIVVALLAGAIIYLQQKPAAAPGVLPAVEQVTGQVETCIREVTVAGAYLMASQGGLIYSRDDALQTDLRQVAYHLKEGVDVAPSRESMEAELSLFIADSLPLCLHDAGVSNMWVLPQSFPEVQTSLQASAIVVQIDYPLSLDAPQITVGKFSSAVRLRLGHMLNVARQLQQDILSNRWIDMHGLAALDLPTRVFPYDNETLVYSLEDEGSEVQGSRLVLNFAVKQAPVARISLDPLPDFRIRVGREFTYDVNATGGFHLYYIESGPAYIDSKTGVLAFTPASPGRYDLVVCAKARNSSECRPMALEAT